MNSLTGAALEEQYKKTLEQRNQLLKDISYMPELIDTLDVWDAQLIRYGSVLIRLREKFVETLSEIIPKGERRKSVSF